jgi:hypothetical protein
MCKPNIVCKRYVPARLIVKLQFSLLNVYCIKTGVFRQITLCRIVISYWWIQRHHVCSIRQQLSISHQKGNTSQYILSSATSSSKHQTSHYSIIYCVYPSTWWIYLGYPLFPLLTKAHGIYMLMRKIVYVTMKTTGRPTTIYFSYLQIVKEDVTW